MRSYFTLSIRGRDWWMPLFAYWVLFVVLFAASLGIARVADDPGLTAVAVITNGALVLLVGLIQAALTIVCYRRAASRLSLDGGTFLFDATPLTYVGLIVIGDLLTIVTLGVYLPWYLRRIESYLAGHTEFRGSRFEFLGRPRALLPVWLLADVCILAVVVFSLLSAGHGRLGGSPGAAAGTALTILLVEMVLFIVLLIYSYAAYRWSVNLRVGTRVIRWETRALPSIGMLVGQFLLTLITLGIYWPAGFLRLYRYFVGRTVASRDGAEVARFGFDGRIGRGFWFLWGQCLLSIITAGIYLPWAVAGVARWMVERSYLDREAAAV